VWRDGHTGAAIGRVLSAAEYADRAGAPCYGISSIVTRFRCYPLASGQVRGPARGEYRTEPIFSPGWRP
ncbi:hypothetical protein ABTZ46_30170, partial [Nocardioides sp. NPDC126508]